MAQDNSQISDLPAANLIGGDISVPGHVAVIMDGNGRWATSRCMPRVEGHRNGASAVRMVVEESRRLGVRYLTLFAFSTENWKRPEGEVGGLMSLFIHYLENELELLLKNDVRLRAIGDRSRLPENVQRLIAEKEAATINLKGMDLILAVSYGGREEIVSAVKQIAEQVANGEIDPSQINDKLFASKMYLPDVPDPDLLIRTSQEFRISNFMLWQLAYSEIVVSPVLWPDFSKQEFLRCLKVFSARTRRFGLTDQQLNSLADEDNSKPEAGLHV